MNNTLAIRHYVIDINVLIPVFSLLGIICILSNALVCYIIIKRKVPIGLIKYYMFSLAITDILVGAVCIPLYISAEWISFYKRMRLLEQKMLLQSVLIMSEVFLLTSSILHLCLIAFDRVIAISKPIYHRQKLQSRSTALKLLTIPWLLAAINATLFINLQDAPISSTVISTVIIVFPSCFITLCYSVLLQTIRKRNRSFSNLQNMQQINEKRIIKTMLTVIIAFAICWMPAIALSIYYIISITHLSYYFSIFVSIGAFMSYLNSACNPFIYAVFNPTFRTATHNTLRNISNRAKASSSEWTAGNRSVQNSTASMETKM